MNLKKTAIALAVAGSVATPMAVQADSGFYGSVRVGLANKNNDTSADKMEFKSHASRFGVKGETDMGNGLTGFGRYEFAVDQNGVSNRHAFAGLKGDFGQLRAVERGYTTWYTHVVAPVDLPWWNSGNGFLHTGRDTNAIEYEGGSGMVKFGVSLHADGSEDTTSMTQAAISFDLGAVNLALGVLTTEAEKAAFASDQAIIDALNTDKSLSTLLDKSEGITGITVSGDAGDIYWGVTLQTGETSDLAGAGSDDMTGLEAHVGFGNAYLQYGQHDLDDSDVTTNGVTLGYTHSIGRNTSAWFEFVTFDGDGVIEDYDAIHAVLKYDWS